MKINPNGQVSVLVHDGKTIVESSVINEYLDDVFPGTSLRPSDPVARACMRVWGKWVDEILMQSVSMIGWQELLARQRGLFVGRHQRLSDDRRRDPALQGNLE